MARPRTDIRPRLLGAARERFLSDGVDGASLRAIARTAKTSIGMLYYYFPSKDDLFFAVVDEVYSDLLADLTRALAADAPAEERLARLYARLAEITDNEVDIVRLVAREILAPSPRLARLIDRFTRGHLPLVIDTLRAGLAEGHLDGRFPPPLLLVLTFAVGALPQLIRRAGSDLPLFADLPEPQAMAQLSLDALLYGIASGKGGRSS
ncbi:MAG TPA: TetR/AcrR family transcriptional regulator [Kofleriaceae bacterium]|nr:TetR/AcrR family transcriptional regulator [Kofleriaceae bacterium]